MSGIKIPLTYAERQVIENYATSHLSCAEISRKISRGSNTVAREYRINGGRKKYNAQKGHERAIEARENQYERLRSINEKNTTLIRIECLEMQIEILTDQLRKLTK